MAKSEKLFNDRKRKVFRKRITTVEIATGGIVAALLIAGGIWFFAQEDNFDPGERDISSALMEAGSVEDKLYRTPLQLWMEPGTAHAATTGTPANIGIFPASILEGGWKQATRLQEFDESNLYEKINGAAPQYTDFGFKRLHYVGLENPDQKVALSIELYDMAEFQNALGIFSAQRAADRVVEPAGNVYFYKTEIGAIGLAGPYYFKLTGDSEDEAVKAKAQEIVQEMNSLLAENAGVPVQFAAFQNDFKIPFEGISFEKIDVFQFSFAKEFWFGTPADGGGLRYFAHQAPDDAAAEDLYAKLREALLEEYQLVQETEAGVLLKHQFLNTFFLLERKGGLVYGADSVPTQPQVETAAAQLRTALFK